MRLADNDDLPEGDGLGSLLALAALGVALGVLAMYALDAPAPEPPDPQAYYVGPGAECPPYSGAPFADAEGFCWPD